MPRNKRWRKVLDGVLKGCFTISIAFVLWILLQVTTMTSFRVPSYSMYPTLIPGDYILVNKWIMGARIFDVWDAIDGKSTNIKRLPGIRNVKRKDVLVFNYPYPITEDSLSMDIMKYYVKRCIALPGDTLEIRKGSYWVNSEKIKMRSVIYDSKTSQWEKDNLNWNERLGWTIQDFGPLAVPAKGQLVLMDILNSKMYGNIIEWEQKKQLKNNENNIYLGDSLITEYRFQENYYFMGGDNLENSKDSRYWGLLPEAYIVGVATRIWKSIDPITDKIRWNRVSKKIE